MQSKCLAAAIQTTAVYLLLVPAWMLGECSVAKREARHFLWLTQLVGALSLSLSLSLSLFHSLSVGRTVHPCTELIYMAACPSIRLSGPFFVALAVTPSLPPSPQGRKYSTHKYVHTYTGYVSAPNIFWTWKLIFPRSGEKMRCKSDTQHHETTLGHGRA